ncbi:MAG: hypothetical protein GX606_02770 [Elusimicrobia bacterium]|nr:hypothetical protein [Elusimicrobiota bacterium]
MPEKIDREEGAKGGGSSPSVSGVKGAFYLLLKVLIAALVAPLIYASTVAFGREVATLSGSVRLALAQGVLIYVFLKFFVYDFAHVYKFGQGLVTGLFQFLKPLVNVAPYLVPVYTMIALIVFAVLNATGKMGEWHGIFYALIAGTFAMHLILTAQDLYTKDTTPGKPTYFFGMGLVYIFDVFVLALIMNVTLPGFDFVRFFKILGGTCLGIYKVVLTQLFFS